MKQYKISILISILNTYYLILNMATIYLIRHGQAQFGMEEYDALSPTGIEQAKILGTKNHSNQNYFWCYETASTNNGFLLRTNANRNHR